MNDPMNPADFLTPPVQVAAYLSSYLQPQAYYLFNMRLSLFIQKAGPKQIAERCGMKIETLCNVMQPQTKLHVSTLIKVLDAMGYQLTITPKD